MKPIQRESYVVACDGKPARFLRRGKGPARWTVVIDQPEAAEPFDSFGEAMGALDEHVQATSGHIHSPPGGWQVLRMISRFRFEAV